VKGYEYGAVEMNWRQVEFIEFIESVEFVELMETGDTIETHRD
jgi:hypothetical protein